MNIKKVIPSGYCKGVINAINIAKQTRNTYPNDKIFVLGMLVHNSYVSKELEQLGIITLDDTNTSKIELLDKIDDGIVIFTAHGISNEIKQIVIQKGLKYVDATCDDVLKTQNIIKNYINNGYDVIYFGKKNHPEAEAVLSISKRIHLVCNVDDINNLNINNTKIFLTNQTTISYLELEKMINITKSIYPEIIIENEICDATSSRQKAITSLKDCDLLYVVGDNKSNNTNKLVELGIQHGIKKVVLIQNYKEINSDDLYEVNNIYITAGASTPPILIDEVINYLSSKFSK